MPRLILVNISIAITAIFTNKQDLYLFKLENFTLIKKKAMI